MCDSRVEVRLKAATALYSSTIQRKNSEIDEKVEEACSKQNNEGLKQTDDVKTLESVVVSLHSLNLRDFSLDLLPTQLASLTALDLSHNELSELPGIERYIIYQHRCRGCVDFIH
jgi:hypothetical protein